jgi:hypothetical protein
MKDDEVTTYLLAGLPAEYDSFITSMTTKSTPLVFTYLMAYEVCQLQHQSELQLHHETSANYAGRGGCGDRGHGHVTRGRGCSSPTRGGTSPRPFEDRRGSSSRPPARSVARSGTGSFGVGTGWMILIKRSLPLLRGHHTFIQGGFEPVQ